MLSKGCQKSMRGIKSLFWRKKVISQYKVNSTAINGYLSQLGRVVRLSLLLEMDPALFRTDAYLNAVSPTPIYSFLTANYRARVSSKVWKRRTRQSVDKRPRSASDGLGAASARNKDRKLDLERIFNKVDDPHTTSKAGGLDKIRLILLSELRIYSA